MTWRRIAYLVGFASTAFVTGYCCSPIAILLGGYMSVFAVLYAHEEFTKRS